MERNRKRMLSEGILMASSNDFIDECFVFVIPNRWPATMAYPSNNFSDGCISLLKNPIIIAPFKTSPNDPHGWRVALKVSIQVDPPRPVQLNPDLLKRKYLIISCEKAKKNFEPLLGEIQIRRRFLDNKTKRIFPLANYANLIFLSSKFHVRFPSRPPACSQHRFQNFLHNPTRISVRSLLTIFLFIFLA